MPARTAAPTANVASHSNACAPTLATAKNPCCSDTSGMAAAACPRPRGSLPAQDFFLPRLAGLRLVVDVIDAQDSARRCAQENQPSMSLVNGRPALSPST